MGKGRDNDYQPPPRQVCCFPFSPKKPLQKTLTTRSSKKIHAGDDVLDIDAGQWGDENRRMITELKEQQRKVKKTQEECARCLVAAVLDGTTSQPAMQDVGGDVTMPDE